MAPSLTLCQPWQRGKDKHRARELDLCTLRVSPHPQWPPGKVSLGKAPGQGVLGSGTCGHEGLPT